MYTQNVPLTAYLREAWILTKKVQALGLQSKAALFGIRRVKYDMLMGRELKQIMELIDIKRRD